MINFIMNLFLKWQMRKLGVKRITYVTVAQVTRLDGSAVDLALKCDTGTGWFSQLQVELKTKDPVDLAMMSDVLVLADRQKTIA